MKHLILWISALIFTILTFVWVQAYPTGPVIWSFTSEHGIHLGDSAVLLPTVVAIFIICLERTRNDRSASPRRRLGWGKRLPDC